MYVGLGAGKEVVGLVEVNARSNVAISPSIEVPASQGQLAHCEF